MKNNMQRVIGNIVILTPVIIGLVFYKQLPNQIAIHFNVEEQANGFMNRNLAIVALPFLALIIYNLCFSFFKKNNDSILKRVYAMVSPNFCCAYPRSYIDCCLRRPCSSSLDCDLVSGTYFSSDWKLSS